MRDLVARRLVGGVLVDPEPRPVDDRRVVEVDQQDVGRGRRSTRDECRSASIIAAFTWFGGTRYDAPTSTSSRIGAAGSE